MPRKELLRENTHVPAKIIPATSPVVLPPPCRLSPCLPPPYTLRFCDLDEGDDDEAVAIPLPASQVPSPQDLGVCTLLPPAFFKSNSLSSSSSSPSQRANRVDCSPCSSSSPEELSRDGGDGLLLPPPAPSAPAPAVGGDSEERAGRGSSVELRVERGRDSGGVGEPIARCRAVGGCGRVTSDERQ